jgi:AraC-like DNA-binding protein
MERFTPSWSKDSVRLIATPSMTAKSTFFYVQEAGYFKTEKDYFTERAHLNSYLVVYTLSGKGYLKYKDKNYTILPGQVFLIDCMEYHYYESDPEDLWEILWIHFNGATSRGYYEQFAKGGSPVAAANQDSSIPSIISSIIDTLRQKSIHAEQFSSKLIVDLLTELLFTNNNQDIFNLFIPDYIQSVMSYMDKHFNEKIRLDEMAKKFFVSKFLLAKEFKKYTGITPNEYLIGTRVNYAKELLQYSNYTVVQIAEMVGIDNVSHFINLFRNRVDMTPLDFRHEWKGTQK